MDVFMILKMLKIQFEANMGFCEQNFTPRMLAVPPDNSGGVFIFYKTFDEGLSYLKELGEKGFKLVEIELPSDITKGMEGEGEEYRKEIEMFIEWA